MTPIFLTQQVGVRKTIPEIKKMETAEERNIRYIKEEAKGTLFTLKGFECGLTNLSEHGVLMREIHYINEKFGKLYNSIQALNLTWECMIDDKRMKETLERAEELAEAEGETPSSPFCSTSGEPSLDGVCCAWCVE